MPVDPEDLDLFDAENQRSAALEESCDALIEPLEQDVDWTRERLEEATNDGSAQEIVQCWRRSYVRAVFAYMEAWLQLMKAQILDGITSSPKWRPTGWLGLEAFTAAELALLRCESYRLDARGHAQIEEARLRFLDDYKFTIRCIAKQTNAPTPDFGGEGIQQLRRAKQVRDRLMHPKEHADLEVTDDELAMIDRAVDAFCGELEEG